MSLIDIKVTADNGGLMATVKAWPFLDVEIVTTNSQIEAVVGPIEKLKVAVVKSGSRWWFKKMTAKS